MKRLGTALSLSLLLHLGLVVLAVVLRETAPRVIVRKGEPLFVELPEPLEEPAPRGNPALPLGPPAPPPRPAPKPPPAKPAPKVEVARPAPKPEPSPPVPARPEPEPAPEPARPRVAKAPPPEPEGMLPAPVGPKPAPAPKEEAAKPAPPAPQISEPRVALAKPPVDLRPDGGASGAPPGGGGGLRRGRGGMEGEPVPLDTADPRYTDYFEKIRRQIKAHWIYPREAGERGIGGQLLIEFGIGKNGWLEFVDLKRSSGVQILDQYAMNAVKLAQPFPPVPDAVAKGTLGIAGIFTYQIVDAGLLNQYLR